jgi:hypothetical protein
LGDTGIDGTVVIKKHAIRLLRGFNSLRIKISGNCCEHNNES